MTKAGTQQAKIIGETIDILEAVGRIFSSRYDTLELQCSPLRGTDYDGNARSPGHSDPTPAQAFELSPYHYRKDSIRDEVISVRHHAQMLAMYVNGIDSDLDTSAIARQHRCTGGMGMEGAEEWGDPECKALADRDHGHNKGLCSKEIRARNRWEKRQAQAA